MIAIDFPDPEDLQYPCACNCGCEQKTDREGDKCELCLFGVHKDEQ